MLTSGQVCSCQQEHLGCVVVHVHDVLLSLRHFSLQNVSQLEVRLALVSARLANCVIYASRTDKEDIKDAAQQQPQQQQQQQQQDQQPMLDNHQQQQQSRNHQSIGVPDGVVLTAAAEDSLNSPPGLTIGTSGTPDSNSRGTGCSSGLQELLAAAGGGGVVQQLESCEAHATHKQQVSLDACLFIKMLLS